jgi:hypothetical protein
MALAHHRSVEQKKAAGGDLPDRIALAVESRFANGRFSEISGLQTDSLTIGGKAVSIASRWSFTATSSAR